MSRKGKPKTCRDAEEQIIKVGDVVRLKSGGPLMVVAYGGCGLAEVMWFDHAGTLQEAEFPPECLSAQDPQDEVPF